jgi:fido (protein-threonine AMPylation protein)
VSLRPRQTVPVDTRQGLATAYQHIEPRLVEAEDRGRVWCFEAAEAGRELDDAVVLDLHRAMFAPLFTWAGTPRTDAFGPGGIEHVPHIEIRVELRKLAGDFAAWNAAIHAGSPLSEVATAIADLHHRVQWIHPFQDTNGRTGRVLDHFVLWSCFGLRSTAPETSPVIEYFPDAEAQTRYFQGLQEADNYRPGKLRAYYTERIEAILAS